MLSPMALPRVSWMLLCCMTLLSQVQGEDLQEKEPSSRLNCPAGSMGFSSHCYTLHMQEMTWMEAEIYCQNHHSGHLTSVLSGAEASFVATMIKTSGIRKSYIWIGLHDPTEGLQQNGGGWRWINNDVLHYRAWEKNPPPCAHNGYCATVSENTGYKQWKDYDCDKPLPFVCRFRG